MTDGKAASPVLLYGSKGSQPTRACLWLLYLGEIPFEFRNAFAFGAPKSSENADIQRLRAINPSARIPCLDDPSDGVALYESPAILTYLATKFNLESLYPNQRVNLRRRALIDQYLSWHHENVRQVTVAWARPELLPQTRKFFGDRYLEIQGKFAYKALKILDQKYFTQHDYVVDDHLSVADLLCFEEISQIVEFEIGPKKEGLQSKFPKLYEWYMRMKQVKYYDEVHTRTYGKLKAQIQQRRSKL